MPKPVAGYLGYNEVDDRPIVKLRVGTRKLLTEDDSGGGGSVTEVESPEGSIAVTAGTGPVIGVDVLGLIETSGPTLLTTADIADQEILMRDGTDIVGVNVADLGDGVYKESLFVNLTSDQTTTSTSFVDIPGVTLSPTIVSGDILLITATASGSMASAGADPKIQLMVDGVAVAACACSALQSPWPVAFAITWRAAGLSAGSRVVKLQWLTTTNTLRIRPAAAPDAEHCALLVERVSA